ncbi:MAG: AAA family ATPase [Bryobacteraceae bacterium]
MRLDRIDLLRYGHFTNRSIELPTTTPDYYVIYGDNEAGKSTLLRGISSLFFGVPARTVDVHSCKASELRIGATISDGEKTFSFRRRKGSSGTLLSLDDGQLPESLVTGFLRELDRDRFEQFFGLTHQRLREGGEELLRGKGDIGSALFQAAGLLDLRTLLEKLDAETKELFSPKSRTKVINCAIDDYKTAKAEVRRLAISGSAIKQKQADLEGAKATHERLKTESESLLHELVRLRRIASNKPDVARLQELRRALLTFEHVPSLPVSARRERDESVGTFTEATGQIQVLTEHIGQLKDRIGALHVNSILKNHAKEIEDLNSETNDYHRSVNDKPKRVNERAEAMQRAEAEWRGIWRDRPISDAEKVRPAYSGKSEIFALVTEHARLATAFVQSDELVRTAREDEDRLREELDRCPDLGDPATLIAAIDQAKVLGDSDEGVARLKSDIERMIAGANRDLKKLRGWSGSTQDLETLRTPLPTTIERYVFEWEQQTAARKERKAQLSEATERIRAKQLEIDRLAGNIGGAGENELSEIRGRRDRLWALIYAAAFEKTLSTEAAQQQSGDSSPIGPNFATQLRRADEIADVRFAYAKDVAIHDRLVKEIETARRDQLRIADEAARLESDDRELHQKWVSEWLALGFEPLSPVEMKEWMQSRQTILEHLEQCHEKEEDLQLRMDRAARAADQIRRCFAQFQAPPVREKDSLTIILRVAEGLAKELQERRRVIEDIQRQLRQLSPEKRQTKQDECKARLDGWAQKWSAVVSELLLPEGRTPEQVGEAIAVLEKVFGHLKDAENLQHRVNRIGENIDLFEKRVAVLIAATDPSLASSAPDVAVTELQSRLVKTGKAETERKALEEQNARDGDIIAGHATKAQRAEANLRRLMGFAHCNSAEELEATITASEQKAEKRDEYERIAQGLIERNAAPDVREIEEESSSHHLDSLQSAIASSENRQKELQDEVFKTGSEYGTLLQEFERLQASDESTLQAQKAEDALGRVRPALAHYLRLQLASEVLQRAIESYREKHQGPVLSRASELFSTLTLGDYCGLTTGFGDNDKAVLVAIRRSKEIVEIDGLSDGTRDQMYLALRLAAIEHHVETVSPCPVILDDILINADNARASATLKVLSDLAKRTQVLFFTHHRHLAELGRAVDAQIIELNSSPVISRAERIGTEAIV